MLTLIKAYLIIFLLVTPNFFSYSQSKDTLTGNISYRALLATIKGQDVQWTNPDGTEEKMKIFEMAIPIDDRMKMLTRDFVRANYGFDSIFLQPRMIVFHSMDLGDLQQSLELSSFLNDQMPANWGALPKAGKLSNGAHFIIEYDGKIICLTPPLSKDGKKVSYEQKDHKWFIKRHQDGNPMAIGIENITERNGDFTDLAEAQLESNAKLARWLLWMEGGKVQYLTSHHQFNDDKEFEEMLRKFSLKHLQKKYRTRERKDIGKENLRKIVQAVNESGYSVHSRFLDK